MHAAGVALVNEPLALAFSATGPPERLRRRRRPRRRRARPGCRSAAGRSSRSSSATRAGVSHPPPLSELVADDRGGLRRVHAVQVGELCPPARARQRPWRAASAIARAASSGNSKPGTEIAVGRQLGGRPFARHEHRGDRDLRGMRRPPRGSRPPTSAAWVTSGGTKIARIASQASLVGKHLDRRAGSPPPDAVAIMSIGLPRDAARRAGTRPSRRLDLRRRAPARRRRRPGTRRRT